MIEEFSKIKGFLEQKEGKALYEACKFSFKTGNCAEIGSYCGKSACYIGLACKEVGSKLYSVDHHRGSEEQQYGEEYFDEEIYDFSANQVNTLPLFLKNIKKFNLQDHIEPMVMTSVDASVNVPDNLDLIFIDGGKGQYSVSRDILNELGFHDLPIIAIAKGKKRNAGEEKIYHKDKEYILEKEGFKLKERINSLVLLN